MEKIYHIGLDVHRRFSQVAVLNANGNTLDKTRLSNDPTMFREYTSRISPRVLLLLWNRPWAGNGFAICFGTKGLMSSWLIPSR